MNSILIICIIASCLNFLKFGDDPDVLTLTYHHGIKLDSIQRPGSRFVFKQLCTTRIDSVISSGNITMRDSKVGKVKRCNYQWQMRQDTLMTVIIETSKKKNTKQLVEQAVQQFGEPVIEKDDDEIIYKWMDQTARHKFSSTLVVDEAKGTGVFKITR